jgi:vancomycin permeability regulator SanA
VELFKAGFAPKLLVTGGGVLAGYRPEARRMADIALKTGISAADLLVEDRSANTFENVQFTCELLQRHGLLEKLKTVLLVSSEWHMQRVRLTARKFMPAKIRFLCCPTLDGCNRRNWTNSEVCRSEVENEAVLIETFLETGALCRDSRC